MIADEKERPFKSLNLIFDLAREKLQSQSDHWRAIDQKNAIIIAVYGILLAMVATIITINANNSLLILEVRE